MKAQPIRIAYAEDHTMVRQAIINDLHSSKGPVNYRVTVSAENGKELIDKIEQEDTPPDLCLLDLYMPVMDAWSAMPVLRERWSAMNILILSMEKDEYKASLLMASGAKGYLVKTGDLTILKNAIEVIHKGGIYYDKEINQFTRTHAQNGLAYNHLKIPGNLTQTELEIIRLLHLHPEMAWKQIASKLNKSYKTLDRSKQRIYDRLNVHNRAELLIYAIAHGIVV